MSIVRRSIAPLLLSDMLVPEVVGSAVTVVTVYLVSKYLSNSNGKDFVAPPLLPVSMIDIIKAQVNSQLPQSILRWSRKYNIGDVFTLNLPKKLFANKPVLIANSDLARRIFLDASSYKPVGLYSRSAAVHDRNVVNFFMSTGKRWSHARKAMAPAFSSFHIKRMKNVAINKINEFMKRLDDPSTLEIGSENFDPGKEMVNMTLQIICDAAFEYRMDEREQHDFLMNMELALKENQKEASIPLRGRLRMLHPAGRKAWNASKDLHRFGRKIIDNFRKIENPEKGTVVDCIVNNSSYENDDERAADIIILMFAGHESTAYSLAWLLIDLAKNQEEQSKLRNHLLSLKSPEDRHNSTIVNFFIKESMRLNPIGSVTGIRASSKDIIVERPKEESNLIIKKDTWLIFSPLVLFRDPKYFSDPDSFIPSRWKDLSKENASAFMPFIMGKYNCIGQTLAMVEMRVALSSLCSQYEFVLEEEGTDTFFTTYKPIGYLLKARKI
jgi:cytochrome P450